MANEQSLLPAQRAQLYEAIKATDLYPAGFRLRDETGQAEVQHAAGYAFVITYSTEGESPTPYAVEMTPGQDGVRDEVQQLAWPEVPELFKNWLVYLKRALEAALPREGDTWEGISP
jgi:hypothetical protein